MNKYDFYSALRIADHTGSRIKYKKHPWREYYTDEVCDLDIHPAQRAALYSGRGDVEAYYWPTKKERLEKERLENEKRKAEEAELEVEKSEVDSLKNKNNKTKIGISISVGSEDKSVDTTETEKKKKKKKKSEKVNKTKADTLNEK